MARHWRDPSAFRADPAAVPPARPSRNQTVALLVVLLLVAGSVTVASFLIRPDRARAFDLVHGSVFIDDSLGPVAIDLASGKPTVQINDVTATVGATSPNQLSVVPLQSSTLLLNSATGEFNLVDNTGFVVKHDGGVPLPQSEASVALPSGDLAYIEQTGPSSTSVYLVTAATVSTAVSATAVKPRAFLSIDEPSTTGPGTATTANDALWVLTGSSGPRTLRELTVPPNSSAGVMLRSTNHGSVTGPAALGSGIDGTTGVVGLAQPDQIRLFGPDGVQKVPFPAPAGVDRILPASDQTGRLAYLMHGHTGWSEVSVGADGSGLRPPTLLSDIAPGSTLVAPAQSNGALYTMDRGGDIYRIDATGASVIHKYPRYQNDQGTVEGKNYDDVSVVARASRVIVDSTFHREAVTIFADDDSRAPLDIVKSAGVPVSALGGPEALTQAHTQRPHPGGPPPTTPPKGPPAPTQQPPKVINHQQCANTGQAPHIPQNVGTKAGSRDVLVTWDYPIIDKNDCVASTYTVTIEAVTNLDAPQPNGTSDPVHNQYVRIQGLYPSTQYYVSVTAWIDGRRADSARRLFTTTPAGPSKPTGLTVVADSDGNWVLNWSACNDVGAGCVPAQSWDVVPSYCDGLGVNQPPPTVPAPPDPSSRQQPTFTYPGTNVELGRGLSFQVVGKGADLTVGDLSASTRCVTSWSPPIRSALDLHASAPADTALGTTTDATVDLNLGADATRDVGGLGASITLTLTGPDGPQTRQFDYRGRSNHIAASFPGIRAGVTYSATATVTAPGAGSGHSVSLGPVTVVTRAPWPSDLSLVASCPRFGIGLACNLTVNIDHLSSAAANNERFDLTTDSRLQCGGITRSLALNNFDPAQTSVTLSNVSQLDELVGQCSVIIGLVENAASPEPLVFGGTISPTLRTPVDLGAPTHANIGHDDLQVDWGGAGNVSVSYDPSLQDKIDNLTVNWTEEIDAPDGTPCGSSTTAQPADLAVASSCVNQHGGDPGQWTMTIAYTEKSDNSQAGPFKYSLTGPVPGYQQCTPAAFVAGWGQTQADGVTVSYSGTDPSELAGCSKWHYTLLDPTGTDCGESDQRPPTDGTGVQLLLTCATAPSAGWQVEIDYRNTANNPQTIVVNVDGEPPET